MMNNLFRFGLIIGISFLGEMLSILIALPIPASIYGLLLMLLLLCARIIPLEAVRAPANFLVEIMPVMFIPAAVALMQSWSALRPMLLPILIIMTVSTFAVMGVSGLVTQALIRKDKKEEEK